MSGHPYNSVLRSGRTRRLWLIIAFAMLGDRGFDRELLAAGA